MKLIELEIKNFMPFKSAKIDFADEDIIGVLGCQNTFNTSNRVGKSSFVEAISYALYGYSRAKKTEELFHAGTEEMSVSLKFEERGRSYSLKRSKDKIGTTLEFSDLKNGSVKQIQNRIEELVGLNQLQFLTTTFFGQEDINRFMYLNPSEKKVFMNEIIGSSRWGKALEIVQLRISALAKLATELEWIAKELEETEKNILSKKDLVRYYDDKLTLLFKQKKLEEAKIAKLNVKVKEAESNLAVFDMVRKDLLQLRSRRKEILIRRKQLIKQRNKFRDVKEIDVDKLVERIKKLRARVNRLQITASREKDRYDEFLLQMPKIVDSKICPILNVSCSRLEKEVNLTLDFQKKRKDLSKKYRGSWFEYKMVAAKLKNAEDKLPAIAERKQLEINIKTELAELEKNLAVLNEDFHKKLAKKNELKKVNASNTVFRWDFEVRSKHLKTLNAEIEQLTPGKISAVKELELLEIEREKKIEAKKRLRITHLKLGDFQFLQYAFGKNGIPSLELENLYSVVEDEINYILSVLGLNLRCRFIAERELTSWEKYCPVCGYEFSGTSKCQKCGTKRQKAKKDELNLQILEGSVERAFHLDSGGGKLLISFALRLALARLIFRRKHIQSSFLILDEVFGALDLNNRERLLELILKNLPSLGFGQIFVISHTDIKDVFDNILVVKRNENFSEIFWHQN